jgi:hypothetical protein
VSLGISVVCVSGMFLWGVSLRRVSGVILWKELRHESLEKLSGVCHCFDGDEHFSRLCNTACPIACNNMCNPARCVVRFAAGGPQATRMAKPAVGCTSLTLNAATCELNGYSRPAEFLLDGRAPPRPPLRNHTRNVTVVIRV